MAKFEEEKVINALHPQKAEVGKKYYYSDNLKLLKKHVEENHTDCIGKLKKVEDGHNFCSFLIAEKNSWELLYPYEEPPKQRMTNIQLMEWVAKGNGLILSQDKMFISNSFLCSKDELNNEVDKDILIHSWYSDDFIEPTVDIYERDCKGGKE